MDDTGKQIQQVRTKVIMGKMLAGDTVKMVSAHTKCETTNKKCPFFYHNTFLSTDFLMPNWLLLSYANNGISKGKTSISDKKNHCIVKDKPQTVLINILLVSP